MFDFELFVVESLGRAVSKMDFSFSRPQAFCFSLGAEKIAGSKNPKVIDSLAEEGSEIPAIERAAVDEDSHRPLRNRSPSASSSASIVATSWFE